MATTLLFFKCQTFPSPQKTLSSLIGFMTKTMMIYGFSITLILISGLFLENQLIETFAEEFFLIICLLTLYALLTLLSSRLPPTTQYLPLQNYAEFNLDMFLTSHYFIRLKTAFLRFARTFQKLSKTFAYVPIPKRSPPMTTRQPPQNSRSQRSSTRWHHSGTKTPSTPYNNRKQSYHNDGGQQFNVPYSQGYDWEAASAKSAPPTSGRRFRDWEESSNHSKASKKSDLEDINENQVYGGTAHRGRSSQRYHQQQRPYERHSRESSEWSHPSETNWCEEHPTDLCSDSGQSQPFEDDRLPEVLQDPWFSPNFDYMSTWIRRDSKGIDRTDAWCYLHNKWRDARNMYPVDVCDHRVYMCLPYKACQPKKEKPQEPWCPSQANTHPQNQWHSQSPHTVSRMEKDQHAQSEESNHCTTQEWAAKLRSEHHKQSSHWQHLKDDFQRESNWPSKSSPSPNDENVDLPSASFAHKFSNTFSASLPMNEAWLAQYNHVTQFDAETTPYLFRTLNQEDTAANVSKSLEEIRVALRMQKDSMVSLVSEHSDSYSFMHEDSTRILQFLEELYQNPESYSKKMIVDDIWGCSSIPSNESIAKHAEAIHKVDKIVGILQQFSANIQISSRLLRESYASRWLAKYRYLQAAGSIDDKVKSTDLDFYKELDEPKKWQPDRIFQDFSIAIEQEAQECVKDSSTMCEKFKKFLEQEKTKPQKEDAPLNNSHKDDGPRLSSQPVPAPDTTATLRDQFPTDDTVNAVNRKIALNEEAKSQEQSSAFPPEPLDFSNPDLVTLPPPEHIPFRMTTEEWKQANWKKFFHGSIDIIDLMDKLFKEAEDDEGFGYVAFLPDYTSDHYPIFPVIVPKSKSVHEFKEDIQHLYTTPIELMLLTVLGTTLNDTEIFDGYVADHSLTILVQKMVPPEDSTQIPLQAEHHQKDNHDEVEDEPAQEHEPLISTTTSEKPKGQGKASCISTPCTVQPANPPHDHMEIEQNPSSPLPLPAQLTSDQDMIAPKEETSSIASGHSRTKKPTTIKKRKPMPKPNPSAPSPQEIANRLSKPKKRKEVNPLNSNSLHSQYNAQAAWDMVSKAPSDVASAIMGCVVDTRKLIHENHDCSDCISK